MNPRWRPSSAEVVDAHPKVYIKSRARRYGPEVRILLTLSAAGDARDEVERRIQSALDGLIAVLATAGFEVEDQPPDEPASLGQARSLSSSLASCSA